MSTVTLRSANVTVKAVGGVFQQPTSTNITLNNQGAVIVNRLDHLTDVVEGTPVDGAVLTYNAAEDKYYVKTLNDGALNNQNLDGGTF